MIETRLLILRAIPALLFTSYRDQTNVLTSVNLSFFIYKMGIITLLVLPSKKVLFSLARVGLLVSEKLAMVAPSGTNENYSPDTITHLRVFWQCLCYA